MSDQPGGSPPVVLVHGLATPSARTWTEAGWAELLADLGRTVIAIDLPGHGTEPALAADGPDLTDWLAARLPEEPADAIGFSLGARVLLGVAARHPGRLARVVAAGVGAQLLDPDPERAERIAAAIRGEPAPGDPVAAYFARLAEHDDVDRAALVRLLTAGPASTGVLTATDLGLITIPVLVVLGDRDDAGPLDPLVEAIPGARGVSLRGVDHFATPKALGFLDAALSFLGP